MTPTGTLLGGLLVAVAAGFGFGGAIAGLRRHRPADPWPWRWIAAGLGLFAVAALAGLSSDLVGFPAPGVSEAAYIPGYLPIVVGLAMLARRVRRGDTWAAAIDAAILAVAVGAVAWIWLVAPLLADPALDGRLVFAVVAFPLVDLLLLALAGYFALGGGTDRPAGARLAIGVTALALADLFYIGVRFRQPGLVDGPDLLWSLAYVAAGLALLDPSMAALGDEPGDDRPGFTRGHLLVLAISVAVGPVLFLITHSTGHQVDPAPEIATVLITALVVLRVALLSRSLEQALLASRSNEERLNLALDAASMATWDWEVATGRLARSEGLDQLYGIANDDRPGHKAFRARVRQEDLPRVREMERAVLDGTVAAEAEFRVLTPAGETRWLRERGRARRDATGAVVRVLGVTHDVTARKLAELASADSDLRLGALVGQLPVVVYVWPAAPDAADEFVSPLAEQWFGVPLADYARTWPDRLHPDDRQAVLARMEEARAANRGYRVEYRERTADGRWLWVRDEAVLLRDAFDQPRYRIGVKSDVSARRAVEEDLRAAKEAAEEASRLKSEFLSTMSHELRTPMNAIIGYTHLLLDGMDGQLTAQQEQDVRQIADGADRLLALIDDVLDIARIESGRLPVAPEPTSVGEAIADVIAELAPLAGDKGLALSASIPDGLPPVLADPARLRQILLNLVGNGIKFTERGAVTVSAALVAGCVEVAVADTGIGIAPAALPHIFDEFRQADSSTTRRYGGTGLGLSIARRLADLQGGAIRVESEPGRGSTFTLAIPVAAVELVTPKPS